MLLLARMLSFAVAESVYGSDGDDLVASAGGHAASATTALAATPTTAPSWLHAPHEAQMQQAAQGQHHALPHVPTVPANGPVGMQM